MGATSMQPEDETAARGGTPESHWGLFWGLLLRDNWKVFLYVLLIILCVLFAPEEPLKFIYTEF